MDIVVTTPHGDADIRVANPRPTTTLADVIVAVTGQAAPAVVRVDGHLLDASTPLARSGLLHGSTIDTATDRPGTEPTALLAIAQIAGPGAGRRHALVSGRHRLGPGRRVHAAELSSAPVEEPAVTIDVGANADVTLHPIDGHDLTLGGSRVELPTTWTEDDVAAVDDRAFVIDRGVHVSPSGDTPVDDGLPAVKGTLAFHRRPRLAAAIARRPAIDAVHDALTRGSGLWQRRIGDPDAFVVPIGTIPSPDPASPDFVTVRLAPTSIVAIAGPRRAALARALLLEATTLHGPADLDLAIATTTVQLGEWDWAKWLPHIRTTGRAAILDEAADIGRWSDARRDGGAHDRLTVLVVDDPELWQRRASPLHQLVTSPPDGVCIVAMSRNSADAPPDAALLLIDEEDRRWRLVPTADAADADADRFLAALVETDVVRNVAIAMAPLDDQDAPPRPPAGWPEPRSLRSLVAPVERSGNDDVLDHVHGRVLIVGADHETDRTATVLALRRCLVRSSRPCWLVDLLGSPWTAGLEGLANLSATELDSGSVDPDRLVARLRRHLGGADGPGEIVVLVDADQQAGAELLASTADLDGLTVLATTTAEVIDPTLPVIHVGRRDGRRHATIAVDGVEHTVTLDDDPDSSELSVRALVVGRALTPLERRVEREATRHPEAFMEQCRAVVAEFTDPTAQRPPDLARPPLPVPLRAESLFERYPGDAIPIGLVDDPADDHTPLWWGPDRGHLVAIGPATAGLDGLLGTVLVGLGDRYGDGEVEIIQDGETNVATLADQLGEPSERTRVVLTDDLGALRRRTREIGRGDVLDTAMADGEVVVVGLARTLDDAGVAASVATTTLLVASQDGDGRCRFAGDGRVVQLAHPTASDARSSGAPA